MKYETGKTLIKMTEDSSVVLGIITLDSNRSNGSYKYFYINGKKRSSSIFKNGELIENESFNLKGKTISKFKNNCLYKYSTYKDSIYLSQVIVTKPSGRHTIVYNNSRDSLLNPTLCFYSFSNELIRKNYYVLPKDTSYQINFKYSNQYVWENVSVSYNGEVISGNRTSYPIKEIKKSKYYSCYCRQREKLDN
tara:strand:+ start:271 stop:849 length:579 start_codon:yes stop_codon:yes gene_type:complete